jgi:hypothetical protein
MNESKTFEAYVRDERAIRTDVQFLPTQMFCLQIFPIPRQMRQTLPAHRLK